MPTTRHSRSILFQQGLGFSTLVILACLVEIFDVPHRIFGADPGFHLDRLVFRVLVVVLIWILVHVTTRRLLKRLHHLEEFLLVCGWCRKVGHDGQWLSMEDYFGTKFNTETSHGICPACAREQIRKAHVAERIR